MSEIVMLFGACFITYIIGYKIGSIDTLKFFKEKLEEHKNDLR